jgi:hypothetical protein
MPTKPSSLRRGLTALTLSLAMASLCACFGSSSSPSLPGDDGSTPELDATPPDAPGPDADATTPASPDSGEDAATPEAEAGAPVEAGEDATLDAPIDAGLEAAPQDGGPIDAPAEAPMLMVGSTVVTGSITGQTSSLVLQDDGADNLSVPTNATTFTFATGLASGAPYSVTVLTPPTNQACLVTNGTGTVSDAGLLGADGGSSGIAVACAIAPPSDLTVTAGGESVTLTWTAVPGASNYNLYEGTASGGEPALGSATTYDVTTTGTTTLSTTVSGLAAGTEYFFFLTSLDSSYNESLIGSNEVHSTVLPLAPAEVTTTPGGAQVTLTWNSVQYGTSYDVYYSTSSNLTGATQVTGAVAGVPITGLTNGTLYYFAVTAVSLGTEGPRSNVVSGTPSAALAVSIANLTNHGVTHSGAVIGRASGTGLSAVEVSIDSGAYVAATGTANWSFLLPTGASTWKEGTAHTIAVKSTDGSSYSPVTTITVRKGVNQDVNADGYADVVVGDSSHETAYVFESAGATGVTTASASAATLTFTSSDMTFGATVTLGDINGDGYADVVVGTAVFSTYFGYCSNENTQTDVYVFQSAGAPVTSAASTAATTILTGQVAGCFGSAVAVGDIDGDGYGDLVVGAMGGTNPTGNTYIFRSPGAAGIASGAYTTATASISGPVLPCNPACGLDEFGVAVAVGDLNGDGYADIAIGDLQYTGAYDEEGAVFVFNSPGAAGITGSKTYSAANATIIGPGAADESGGDSGLEGQFGASVAIGDLNADGYGDLVIGSPFAVSSNPSYWEYDLGTVYGFESAGTSGVASATYASAAVTLVGPTASYCCRGDDVGLSVGVGDMNGDGYADIAMTSYNTAEAYIFESSGAPVGNAVTTDASTALAVPRTSNLTMADVNGDGFVDVITALGSTAYVFESVGTSPIPSGGTGAANTVLTGTAGASLAVAP